ncbi:MAG: hypothetical protein H6710_04860 [Myxococcales bacterium]|nr:hypothetical protein [Myxococcales bacterium]
MLTRLALALALALALGCATDYTVSTSAAGESESEGEVSASSSSSTSTSSSSSSSSSTSSGDSCPDGQDRCDGECVDLDVDPANCGACGVTCGVGSLCLKRACVEAKIASCDACPCDECEGELPLCCDQALDGAIVCASGEECVH